jgi:hypothetical protein
MVKIKLECWWADTPSLNERMVRQFIKDEDLDNYCLVENNPDFTIVFGKTEWNKIETPKENTFYFSQEPLWSPNQPKDGIHDYCSRIFISDKKDYPDKEEYMESLLPMFYGSNGEKDHREEWDWSKKIENKKYVKSKIVSIVVRKDGSEHYHHLSNPETSKINYGKRTSLAIKLSENENIDVFGHYWESNGKNIKGGLWNKHLGLDEYQFSFCFENSLQKNYVSEKFWDAILTDTVPIYLGCSNITDYIPSDCFINLNNLSDDEILKKVEDIILNHDDYYNIFLEKISKLKKDFFINPTYNIWENIKQEIKNK